MKTNRKRKRRVPTTADAPPVTQPHATFVKLPVQAIPVIRGVKRDAINAAISASTLDCAKCFATCRTHGGPLQSVCESVCAAYCSL